MTHPTYNELERLRRISQEAREHDLKARNLLQSIQMCADVLADPTSPVSWTERLEYAEIIVACSERLEEAFAQHAKELRGGG